MRNERIGLSRDENRLRGTVEVIKLEKTMGRGMRDDEGVGEGREQRLAWPSSSKSRNGVTGRPREIMRNHFGMEIKIR